MPDEVIELRAALARACSLSNYVRGPSTGPESRTPAKPTASRNAAPVCR